MKKKLIILLDALISIALIFFILSFVGLEDVLDSLLNINLFFLFLSILFLLLMYCVMIFRIKILLDELKVKTSIINIVKSHFLGMLLADFTPARTGYFATAANLHYTYKLPSEKSLISILGPAIFDFSFKVTAGIIAIFLLLYNFVNTDQLLLFLGVIVMVFMIFIMILTVFSKRFLKIFSFSKAFPFIGGIYLMIERMQANSNVIIKKTPHLLVLLIFSWTFKSVSWYLIAKSLGITLNIWFPEIFFYFFLQPLLTMLEFLPSPTIAGLGLSEAGAVLIFSLYGVPAALGTSFALVARLKTILVNIFGISELIKLLRTISFDQLLKN